MSNPTNGHTTNGHILIVDDEIEFLGALGDALGCQQFEVTMLQSPEEALAALKEQDFDVVCCDMLMPDMNGVEVLRAALEIDPLLVGIILTGQGTLPSAMEALQIGAYDYVLKPFKLQAMLPILRRAVQFRRLKLENQRLREYVHVLESHGSDERRPRGAVSPRVATDAAAAD